VLETESARAKGLVDAHDLLVGIEVRAFIETEAGREKLARFHIDSYSF
jgi:hypothetical protein